MTVQRWTGSTWVPVAAALPFASGSATLVPLPDGDLLVSWYDVLFDLSTMARWEMPAATGSTIDGNLVAAAGHPDGSVYLCGQWGGGYFAHLVSSCPASVLAFGNSCSGSVGPVTLDATRAWIGGTCRLTADGFGPNSFALSIQGVPLPPQPLALLFVVPGCALAATVDQIGTALPTNGRVEEAVSVPNAPVLIGLTVARQDADIELDAGANIVLAATSNAQAPTVGAF